jgi:hypothetical protein
VSHRILVTSASNVVDHWHKDDVYGELSAADKASMQASALSTYPGITPVEYIHLDHTVEVLLPSYKWNCWGFTFNPRQCWVGLDGADIQLILNDNGTQVFVPNLRIGDVVVYKSGGSITHTGRIWTLDAAGNAALVQSKWGSLGEYFHAPTTVPASYGVDITYWRVTPLSGKGDAWSKDCGADDRLPFAPCSEFYLSPDLWCNNAGGTTHENPHRGSPNQLWVRVRNADSLAITGAEVRVYWSDPTGGMPHTDWHLIGTATANVVAGAGNEVIAGPIMWTPGAGEPEHCCLFAIVNTGDDYHEPTTLDPIVWPFDVARDNNIVWKNMWIETVPPPPPPGAPSGPAPSQGKTLTFVARNPLAVAAAIEVRVKVRPLRAEEVLRMGFSAEALKRAGGPVLKDLAEVQPIARGALAKPEAWPAGGSKLTRFLGPKIKPKVAVNFKMETSWRKLGGTLHDKGLVFSLGKVAPGKGSRIDFNVAALVGAKPGDIHRIDFEQRTGGQLTGGGAYVIVVKG